MNALDATMRERAKAIEGSLGYLERLARHQECRSRGMGCHAQHRAADNT